MKNIDYLRILVIILGLIAIIIQFLAIQKGDIQLLKMVILCLWATYGINGFIQFKQAQ